MTEANTEVRCPKCSSNQITANKKGFSGTKAVVGGVLTGGIGLLAGTIGSNKVIITCLSCGHRFKPGEGKIATIRSSDILPSRSIEQPKIFIEQPLPSIEQPLPAKTQIPRSPDFENFNNHLISIYKVEGKLSAVKYCHEAQGWTLKQSKEYVESLDEKDLTTKKKEGCFIATACYGDYNAPEVMLLRRFRDQKLSKTSNGRLIINAYYYVSPSISNIIARSDSLKKIVRKYILEPMISRL